MDDLTRGMWKRKRKKSGGMYDVADTFAAHLVGQEICYTANTVFKSSTFRYACDWRENIRENMEFSFAKETGIWFYIIRGNNERERWGCVAKESIAGFDRRGSTPLFPEPIRLRQNN